MRAFDFRKLTNESPLFLLCGISILLTVSLLRFAFLPQYIRLAAHRKELERYSSLISSETGIGKIKQDITEKIEVLKKRLAPSPEQRKLTNDVSRYLEMLIAVARKADIRFIRIQPQEETQAAEYTLSPVVLVCTTTYHELGQFIAALEKTPNLFSIDRLAIDAATNGKCDVKLLVTCLVPREQTDD
jgi:Tfp pilus assembly protein PilO